ncbi:MAG: hypothetical protein B6I35_14955 [Anaerolineaceae bacterium 4572_32.2]|nr:MAG: hypothetical protein B6I35_14955 [Anaerolineaceae bacterium 4572_32.2]HEY73123.1 hypothetical protein [Thermoflexia bacterium]
MTIASQTIPSGAALEQRPFKEATDPIEAARAELVDTIAATVGMPMDVRAVAATLESAGLRDVDAQTDFGAENLFDLAQDIYGRARRRVIGAGGGPQELERRGLLHRVGRFIKFYLKGSLFAAPMTAQIIVLFALSSSLWAWLFFSERQATVIAVGTILSYIVTGGFSQIISRRGMFYWQQEIYLLAKRISLDFLQAGVVLTLVAAILMYVVNLILPIFEQDMILICIMYFVLLSLLWLNVSILYMLEQHLAILLSTVIGGVLVWVIMTYLGWSIYISHAVGIIVSNLIAFVWGRQILARKARDVVGVQKLAQMPRYSIIAWATSPYFVYGVLYFGFLFLDRVVGWSAPYSPGGEPSPYIIWFRTAYEVGIDLALISLILTIAMLEYTINEFASMIIPVQESVSAFDVRRHNRSFKAFYVRQLILLAIVTVFSVIISGIIVDWLRTLPWAAMGDDFITPFVYRWGMVGYAFLALGLLNAVFFLSLSRPRFVLRAIGVGFLVNVVVGFLLSRIVVYYYSVFGLVAGGIVFGLLSTWYAWRVMDELDYYYYSSY